MGLKDLRRRLTQSTDDDNKERLHGRFEAVRGTPISEAPLRVPVQLVGEVAAMQVVPRASCPSLEVTIDDGTGRATAVFVGRRRIAGLAPGAGVVIDGVGRQEKGRLVFLNPAYTLLPHA